MHWYICTQTLPFTNGLKAIIFEYCAHTRKPQNKKQKREREKEKKKGREKRKANIAENLLVSNVIPYFLMTK